MNGTWIILDQEGIAESLAWVEKHYPQGTPRPLWHPVSRYFWAMKADDEDGQQIALWQMADIGQPFEKDQYA